MGTATTICAGAFFRKAVTATRMEEPVARPSSTRIAVRPPHHSGIDYFLGNSESVDHVTVQDRNAPGRQSSHCKFFLSGNAQFSHNKHIEGRMERSRYFVSDGNASPRKGQYDNIRAICKFAQSGCQQTSGFESVFKQHGPVSIRRPSPPFSDKYPSVRPGQECVPPSLP